MHSGDMLYKCKFCPKEMNSMGNMSNHIRAAHLREWDQFKNAQREADEAEIRNTPKTGNEAS